MGCPPKKDRGGHRGEVTVRGGSTVLRRILTIKKSLKN